VEEYGNLENKLRSTLNDNENLRRGLSEY